MSKRTKKAAAATTAHKKNVQRAESYRQTQGPSIENRRAERIRKYRSEMPAIHRKTYDRAIQGKSHKSAINSFCLACVMWQKEEVRLCTSLACPLYPYRPYKEKPKQASEDVSFGPEVQNSGEGGQGHG